MPRRWQLRAGLFLASSLASLIACEALARCFFSPYDLLVRVEKERFQSKMVIDRPKTALRSTSDPELYFELTPGYRVPTDDYFSVSSLGLRDFERYTVKKPRGTFRILVVGDSVAAGIRAPMNHSLAKLMELELNCPGSLDAIDLHDSSPPRPPYAGPEERKRLESLGAALEKPGAVEVLNGGVEGFDTRMVARYVEVKAGALEPDLIVYAYCLNDRCTSGVPYLQKFEPSGEQTTIVNYQANYPYVWELPEWLNELLLTKVRLYAMLQRALCSWAQGAGQGDRVKHLWYGNETTEQSLERLRAACRRLSCPLYVVVFPYLFDYADYRFAHEHEWIWGQCWKLKLPVVDLLADFKAAGLAAVRPASDHGAIDTVHPNSMGYKLAAAAVLRRLEKDRAIRR